MEVWVHKYKYSHDKKRKKFKKLLKQGIVIKMHNPEYNLSDHIVYQYKKKELL